jgi:hypothetical protein
MPHKVNIPQDHHMHHEGMTHDSTHHPPGEHEQPLHDQTANKEASAKPTAEVAGGHAGMHGHMHGGGDMPMFANITIAVCHCGAGCVLGDIVGEWIVYATGITISGRDIWPEWLIGERLFVNR